MVAAVIKDWQINGIFSAFSGTPFTIAGDNTALNQRQGQQTIDQVSEPRRVGDAGPDEPYYDPAAFAQPGNKWGNTGRNFLRGPGQWNLDLSLFKADSVRPLSCRVPRARRSNVLNHSRWGNPVTGFTDPNFMRIRSNQPARQIQLGPQLPVLTRGRLKRSWPEGFFLPAIFLDCWPTDHSDDSRSQYSS